MSLKLTRKWLKKHRTPAGGFNRAQLEILGIKWPPKTKWIRKQVGRVISDTQAERFIQASGQSRERRQKLTPAERIEALPFRRSYRIDSDSIRAGSRLSRESAAVLTEFWGRVGRRETHLGLLQEFAEVQVKATGQYRELRKHRAALIIQVHHYQCFVCAGPATLGHHVIQLMHGGTNHRANLVPLCEPCHQTVHPWMPADALKPEDAPLWHREEPPDVPIKADPMRPRLVRKTQF